MICIWLSARGGCLPALPGVIKWFSFLSKFKTQVQNPHNACLCEARQRVRRVRRVRRRCLLELVFSSAHCVGVMALLIGGFRKRCWCTAIVGQVDDIDAVAVCTNMCVVVFIAATVAVWVFFVVRLLMARCRRSSAARLDMTCRCYVLPHTRIQGVTVFRNFDCSQTS